MFEFLFRLLRKEKKDSPTVASKPRAVIYMDRQYRGSMVDDEIRNRKEIEFLKISSMTPWEYDKNIKNPKIAEFIKNKLLPELENLGSLDPLVIWRHKKKNYVIDGHHRLLAYGLAGGDRYVSVVFVKDEEVLLTEWTPYCGLPHP